MLRYYGRCNLGYRPTLHKPTKSTLHGYLNHEFNVVWLNAHTSLTKDLKRATQNHIAVAHVQTRRRLPSAFEIQYLGIKPQQWVTERQVELYDTRSKTVYVKAKTIFSHRIQQGQARQFKNLGHRPIGSILFRDNALHKTKRWHNALSLTNKNILPQRISLYTWHQFDILVLEQFTLEFIQFLQPEHTAC